MVTFKDGCPTEWKYTTRNIDKFEACYFLVRRTGRAFVRFCWLSPYDHYSCLTSFRIIDVFQDKTYVSETFISNAAR